MTEQEFLTSNDPVAMLRHLRYESGGFVVGGNRTVKERNPSLTSDRKLRLFAYAVALNYGSKNRKFQQGFENALSYANGGTVELQNTWAVMLTPGMMVDAIAPYFQAYGSHIAAILRDIFGNPYRPINILENYQADDGWGVTDRRRPGWLTWEDGTVPRIAWAIYDERAFDRLGILADALEEAGCEDWWMLSHLRSQEMCPQCLAGPDRKRCTNCHEGNIPLRGPHVRGCHVLDLILGKK